MRPAPKMPARAEARRLMLDEASKMIVVRVWISEPCPPACHEDKTVVVRAMVDTGATGTVVRLSAVRGKLPYRCPPRAWRKRNMGLSSLFGGLQVVGAIRVLLRAEGGPELPITVGIIDLSRLTILRALDADMILGLDYLELSAATIDVASKTLRYGIESPRRSTRPLDAGWRR